MAERKTVKGDQRGTAVVMIPIASAAKAKIMWSKPVVSCKFLVLKHGKKVRYHAEDQAKD
ncbi:MAG: hypothetical protein FD174_1593 [Geobacteraceae bacterium]|nr:MAG: hypothetical protein FD174_1593 [Geobacteraceae bacterium]